MILYNQSSLKILKNSFEYIAATADVIIAVKSVKVWKKESGKDSKVREIKIWRLHRQSIT